MPSTTAPIIRRLPDGSIDFDHYDRIARRQRACDQRAALTLLIAPAHSLLGTLWHWLLDLSALVSRSWRLRLYSARLSAHSRR